MPDIDTQIALEELHNKNQTLPRIRKEFDIPMIQEHCEQSGIPVKFAVELLAQMVLHRRADVSTLVGILHHHFSPGGQAPGARPARPVLQACADMVDQAINANLVFWDEISEKVVMRIDIAPSVYEDLERYQYPLPMLVRPRELKTNQDTGYFSRGSARGSVILRAGNHHDYDVCLDHLNRVNQVKLTVNHDVAQLIQNRWKDLDRKKEGETHQDFQKRVAAFEKYDRTAKDVLQHLAVAGNEFYLTHRYDKRGRTYAQGYHVNPQGNDWNKAVIELADQELVR